MLWLTRKPPAAATVSCFFMLAKEKCYRTRTTRQATQVALSRIRTSPTSATLSYPIDWFSSALASLRINHCSLCDATCKRIHWSADKVIRFPRYFCRFGCSRVSQSALRPPNGQVVRQPVRRVPEGRAESSRR
jgi:hypothetical protein